MTELNLDWSAAEYELHNGVGLIAIPIIDAPESNAWWSGFQDALAIHESETRGQVWRGLAVSDAEVVVQGVPEEVDPPTVKVRLEEYLKGVATSADHAVSRVENSEVDSDAEAEQARRLGKVEEYQRRLRDET